MGEIIAVYGKEGSGKSTFSVNLACALSEKQKIVILMPAQLNFGGVQILLNEIIDSNKGIFKAMQDKAEQPEKFLTQCKINQNLYLMGVPNQTFEPYLAGLEKTKVEMILRKLAIHSDYLIVDCTADLYNGLTLMGMAKANQIFCMYRSTISSCLWHNSMYSSISQLTDTKIKPIISEYEIGCSIQEFLNKTSLNCKAFLPDVGNATILESLGKPIYYDRTKVSEKYILEINSVVSDLLGGIRA